MDIHSIIIKTKDFTIHLMQHLSSHHLRKQTPFSTHLRKSTYKRGNTVVTRNRCILSLELLDVKIEEMNCNPREQYV